MAMIPSHLSRISGAARKKGFALLIAVIFMSVMLSFGLALGSLAYKQQVLASGAIESQTSFYVADAGLECLLYADQQQNLFAYPASQPSSAPQMTCEGQNPVSTDFTYTSGASGEFVVATRLSLDGGAHCADVTIYKPATASSQSTLFSQGYDTTCANVAAGSGVRFVARGLEAHY